MRRRAIHAARLRSYAASDDACSQPRQTGTGEFSLPRFYYDPAQRACLPFTYNGLQGNMNNFLTQEDCTTTCPGNLLS